MNNEQFVCQWSESFDNDGYNDSNVIFYSSHDSFEEAQNNAKQGYRAYCVLSGETKPHQLEKYLQRNWKAIFCTTILEYHNDGLVGTYEYMQDEWRFYPKQPHWKQSHSKMIKFPPII